MDVNEAWGKMAKACKTYAERYQLVEQYRTTLKTEPPADLFGIGTSTTLVTPRTYAPKYTNFNDPMNNLDDLIQKVKQVELSAIPGRISDSSILKELELPPDPKILDPISQSVYFNNGNSQATMFFKDPSVSMVSFETPSTLMVMKATNSEIVFQTNKFLLQSITKPQQEKFQVVETFGNPHVFFYGARTKVYAFQGVLLDGFRVHHPATVQTRSEKEQANKNMWATAFQDFYEKHLRGTRLKDNGNIAALYVNGWLIKGYPVQLTIMKESNQLPDGVTFQMSWVIEEEQLIRAQSAEHLYQMPNKDAAVVLALNKVNALQNEYFKARNEYFDMDRNAPNLDTKKKLYKLAGEEVTNAQKELETLLRKYGGNKARRALNLD